MLYAKQKLESSGWSVRVLDRKVLYRSCLFKFLRPIDRGAFAPIVEAIAFSRLAAHWACCSDFIISNGYAAPWLHADLLFCHGTMRGSRFAEKGRTFFWSPEQFLELVAARRARSIAAVSSRAGKELARFYSIDSMKIHILPNCIDGMRFFADTENHGQSGWNRKREGKIRVLFVGALGNRKGIDRVLGLMNSFYGKNFEFAFVTQTAPDSEEARLLTGAEMHFKKTLGELPAIYSSCDVMYFPSRYEGFEMVSLESLACGTPVVGTRVGGMAEMAARNQPGVTVVDNPDDYETVALALEKSSAEWRRSEKKQKLHDAAVAEYGIDKWGDRLLRVLDERY